MRHFWMVENLLPKVSIIIPCYNKVAYVAETIKSALAQTYPCEVIVIDDGSTDGSLEEIKRFEDRITIETGANRGACAARNRGVSLATGDYLQFLDADDVLPQEKIAAQLERLEGSCEGSVATCPWVRLQDNGHIAPPSPRPYWHDYSDGTTLLLEMWYRGGHLPTVTWLVPRSLAITAGFWDSDLAADQDGDFFGRVLTISNRVLFCSETQAMYREPPLGAVSRDKSYRAGQSRLHAFESVAELILKQRNDRAARKACLSRIRRTAYALLEFDGLLNSACRWEKRLSIFDFSPALPLGARFLVGLLGLRYGLRIREILKTS